MIVDRLRIYLFGEPHFELGGTAFRFSAPPKTLPLLAYLLLHRRGPVAREMLATLLWPDADQTTAYSNLRRHLHYLTKALPPVQNRVPWIVSTNTSVAWNLESPYWLDVEALETEINERHLRAHAVRLYSGDLYERCSEEWIDFERERLRTLQLSNLAQLCADAQKRSSYVEALQYAQLMLAADPWREDALRATMETRMLLGDRAGALAEYERFASRLRDELATSPLEETTAAYRRIQRSLSTPNADRAAAHTRALTLIGRQNELATLRAQWQRAACGEGRMVFIGGEAGIGKTTLLEALSGAAVESGGAVLTAAATPDDDTAYSAFLALAHTVGADLLTPVSGGDDRLRSFEAFAAALEQLAKSKPLLVCVEDLHWAGVATLDLLRYLVLRLSRAPVLLVGTYREFEIHRGHPLRALRRQLANTRHCITVALSALGRDDVRELARFCAGRNLHEDLIRRIYERSDGNPLFVTEIVREVRESGHEQVPASIAEIVRERLDRLPAPARTFAQTAAIAGNGFSPALLVQVTGIREAEVLAFVDDLVASHFLRQTSGEAFSFVHEVIREAVYQGIAADAARATHARVGFALRALHADRFGDVAATAARHFDLGGIGEAAVDAYLVAAEYALEVYAIDEAGEYAQKALDGVRAPRDRFRALRVLEFAAGCRAGHHEQRTYLEQLLALWTALGNDERADILIRYVDFSSAGPPEVQREALGCLEDFLTASPRLQASYLLRRGEYLSRIGDVREAKRVLQQALVQLSPGKDVDALLRCLTGLYIVALNAGDSLDELQHRVGSVRAKLEHTADARIGARLAFVQCAAFLDRDPAGAAEIAEDMLRCAYAAGDVWLEALAHRSSGACATRRMLIGAAQRHLARSAEITLAAGRLRDLARVRSWQLMVENRCANFAAAERYGAQGLDAARASGATDLVASMLANLANTAVWAGNLDTAEERLREAVRLGKERGYAHPSMQSLLGEVLIGHGKLDEGLALIEDAWATSSPQDDALGTRRVHLPLLLGLAYLASGRFEEARAHAESIRRELDAFRSYYIHPQVYLWAAAQLLRIVGHPEDAATFSDAARRRHQDILASIDDAASRESFQTFVFNLLVEADACVDDPLHAWFLPYETPLGSSRRPSILRV